MKKIQSRTSSLKKKSILWLCVTNGKLTDKLIAKLRCSSCWCGQPWTSKFFENSRSVWFNRPLHGYKFTVGSTSFLQKPCASYWMVLEKEITEHYYLISFNWFVSDKSGDGSFLTLLINIYLSIILQTVHEWLRNKKQVGTWIWSHFWWSTGYMPSMAFLVLNGCLFSTACNNRY